MLGLSLELRCQSHLGSAHTALHEFEKALEMLKTLPAHATQDVVPAKFDTLETLLRCFCLAQHDLLLR